MTYYTIALLAQLGIALIALGLIVRHYKPRNAKGATPANKQQIGAHWHRREMYMLRNGGLPVTMREIGK